MHHLTAWRTPRYHVSTVFAAVVHSTVSKPKHLRECSVDPYVTRNPLKAVHARAIYCILYTVFVDSQYTVLVEISRLRQCCCLAHVLLSSLFVLNDCVAPSQSEACEALSATTACSLPDCFAIRIDTPPMFQRSHSVDAYEHVHKCTCDSW